MNWDYSEEQNAWNLLDNSSVIARIFIKEKPDRKRRYATKTLIASVYLGAKTFSRLGRKNKEWKVYNRKFHTREEMEKYLEAKKSAVIKFLSQF